MSQIFKEPERKVVSRKRRFFQLLAILVLGVAAALVVEHWRGERALRAWKERKLAEGEIFDPVKLWPAPSTNAAQFSNQLAAALAQIPKGLEKFAGYVSGISTDESGRTGRGSRQPRPVPPSYPVQSTWPELESALKESEPGLKLLRQLMKDPPRSLGLTIDERLEEFLVPNYIGTRRSAQSLSAAAICNLHQNNIAVALENLEAMQGCARLYADEPTLVNYMVRVAVLGLADSAGWDALQETGWTDAQLTRFQRACEANDLWPQLPKVFAAERLGRVHSLQWLASHGYREWDGLFSDVLKSFGAKPSARDGAPWVRPWRQFVFNPTWSYAWRAQEELQYLEFSQRNLDIVQEAVRRGAWSHLNNGEAALRHTYQCPAAGWRFYQKLPLQDWAGPMVGDKPSAEPECPYPNYAKAWLATARMVNLHEMLLTAIALKRYQLQHSRVPGSLTELVPAYLQRVPRDIVDGQPLRYRRNADDSFVLYSIGENAKDEGGDSRLADGASHHYPDGYGSGRDWVWPQVTPLIRTARK